jgi:hypothetical protein
MSLKFIGNYPTDWKAFDTGCSDLTSEEIQARHAKYLSQHIVGEPQQVDQSWGYSVQELKQKGLVGLYLPARTEG